MTSDISKASRSAVPENRCRLVLIVSARETGADLLRQCLSAGDVASVICRMPEESDSQASQRITELVEAAHEADVPLLVENDTQLMGRSGADGLFVSQGLSELKERIARFSPKMIVGYGNCKTRHDAMSAGESLPDFLFFGKLGKDIRPEPHPKNIALAEWCVDVMDLPVIVMGGNEMESVIDVAQTGAEFVALDRAVFADAQNAASAVAAVNALLDEKAPRLVDPDA